MANCHGPYPRLLKIYQLMDVLNYQIHSELLDMIDYTCGSVLCDSQSGELGRA